MRPQVSYHRLMNDREYHSPLATELTKRWFVLRHGRSQANETGIVASQLSNAGTAFGLTDSGREEVEVSVRQAQYLLQKAPPLSILMSPLLRTRQTAEIAATMLGVQPEIDQRLIERDFGDYELLSDDHYQHVWEADRIDPERVPGRAESVYRVTERVCDLILEFEKKPDIATYLLVTHCDVAMILSSAFQNLDPRNHRLLDPIKTGEIRALVQPQTGPSN